MWGELEPGPYAVGFRRLRLVDVTRPPFEDDPDARGRVLPVFVWYPARSGGRPTSFGRYVDELADDWDSLGGVRREGGLRRLVAHAAELGGDTAMLRARLPDVLALPTYATAGAPAAAGRHPVFLFPAYLAPATNSIVSEFLASRGYVVVSTPLVGTRERAPDISTRGLETQAADLRLAVAAADTLSFVDGRRLAAGGVGINASAR